MSKNKRTNVRPAQAYERKESYLPHEVLDFLPNPDDYPKNTKMKTIKKDYDGDLMKMGSDRYYTFKKSLNCAFCDLTGSVMYKERSMGKNGSKQECGYHFNLYAIDKSGNEVLMTKDHVIPKSRGGRDVLKNYQTCCKLCNEIKGATKNDKFKEEILLNNDILMSPRAGMSITESLKITSKFSFESPF